MNRGKPKAEGIDRSVPKVGIFWVVRGSLITLGIPVTEGKGYGEYAVYESSHYDKWHELQRSGAVPRDCEYEEHPRGRIAYDRLNDTFFLRADTCILGDKRILSQIMQEMRLPKERTVLGSDDHYRCFRCLGIG
jgi:hypothetical protein